MQVIETTRELKAVLEGGIRYIFEQFGRGKILCHPDAPVTFLPSWFNKYPGTAQPMLLSWLMVYSVDRRTWGHDFGKVMEMAANRDGHFYISDWKLNVILQVEIYMLQEVFDLLTIECDDIMLISGWKWKETVAGSLEYFTVPEYYAK